MFYALCLSVIVSIRMVSFKKKNNNKIGYHGACSPSPEPPKFFLLLLVSICTEIVRLCSNSCLYFNNDLVCVRS